MANKITVKSPTEINKYLNGTTANLVPVWKKVGFDVSREVSHVLVHQAPLSRLVVSPRWKKGVLEIYPNQGQVKFICDFVANSGGRRLTENPTLVAVLPQNEDLTPQQRLL